jgi:predicted DNA binding CopG/RHH family protein
VADKTNGLEDKMTKVDDKQAKVEDKNFLTQKIYNFLRKTRFGGTKKLRKTNFSINFRKNEKCL